MSQRRALGRGRDLAVTATKLLRRGTSSSFEVTHLHTRASEKKHSRTHMHGTFIHARTRASSCAHAPTHTDACARKVRTSSSRPSTSSLLPQFTVSPSGGTRSFEGDERAGVSERKGKGICRVRRDGEEEERKRG